MKNTSIKNKDIENNIKEEKVGENRFKNKSVQRTLKIRLLSTFVLLLLLALYLLSGIFYTTFYYKNIYWFDILAYISMGCSVLILFGATFEMARILKHNNWLWYISLFIINTILFLIPTTKSAYSFGFYITLIDDELFKNMWWIFILAAICLYSIVIAIASMRREIEFKKALINGVMQLIAVLGLKTFTILMLSQNTNLIVELIGKKDGGKGEYSYNTVLWIWMMIIFGDSFAYLGGLRFGKTQLAPNISPKKTWEGALIGTGVAIFAGLLYAIMFHIFQPSVQPLWDPINQLGQQSEWKPFLIYILLSIVIPIIGLIGDLIYSMVKRFMNTKDYSNFIPGHGGILDRLDSILFTLAIVFVMVAFI